jgi:molybdate transport system substrate-binding protein
MKRLLLPLALLPLLLAGCGSDTPSASKPESRRTVTVFAAASLTKAFQAEGKAFEQSHKNLTVTFSFAGSQALVAQIQQGAPASVLATADLATSLTVKNLLGTAPTVFAHNQLAIVTAPENPKHLTSLADLARPGLKVVLAGPTVPVGKAAAKALAAAKVTVKPVSLEDSVTGVVTKVRLGEADAGIAYVTDLAGATDVGGAPVPGTTTDLVISTLKGISAPDDADAFIGFLQSGEGKAILTSFGFS